jgi:hypothetical protein
MKNVCDSSTPASVRSSSVRSRTEPFKSIVHDGLAEARTAAGCAWMDTAAAAAGCAMGGIKVLLLACGSSLFHSWFG